ncbi:endonuclease/exonuclease/phosphatase family metal-dependent hydrolase [Knoellia remsis]|uniref:Endonuclease/exonuclease/phosphatase family metal-dependent hydrolase n=1 Tax=Knoellia remsis TaxID=407159 RepID=A0A2T0UXS4_9MICO|nr:endonuclease/exonuclease/phosphatase family protein [Knoellia remsis]PRY62647.1 endonuclease/exonuclease/phosphatase family metal-dependent hydrolase [Knoellia remsis]
MRTMRVASYNTRDFLGDPYAAARVVRAIDPDVLCLQEVPRRLFSSQRVAGFARDCGMFWSGRHRGSGGTTIFTSLRVDVVESRHHRLRVARLQRTRGFALARVAVPGREPVAVASVHLSLDAAERAAHAKVILDTLGRDSELVLAGDLNETETGAAWQAFAGVMRLVSPTTPTYPAARPRRVLDVIFATPGLEAAPHADVELSEEDLVAASDHRPTWVDLVIDAPTAAQEQAEEGAEAVSETVTEESVARAEASAQEAEDTPQPG